MTLNQVINRIKVLSLSHKQINSFYFGEVPEFDANNDVNYPACFLEIQPGSIDRTEKLQTFNFRCFLADRVMVSESTEDNETEVLSDMSSVAADLIAMLVHYENEEDGIVSVNNVVTPFTEGLNDMVAGVVIELGIQVEFLIDSCQVPSEDVEFETDFDMARTKIITYTADGTEGESFTVSDIASKTVLAAYRAGSYKRILTTTPTDTDKIRVTGTDLGSNKGIVATGNVRLSSGDFLVSGEVLDFLVWSS